MYRSVSSTHRPTVGCSPPSVPSEEDVAEPDGRVAPSITSPGTERKCPRCLATSGQQAWGTLAISSRDVPGADFARFTGERRGPRLLTYGGGRWTFSPCQQDDGPSTGLLVALQCSMLGSSPPGPQNMAGCGDGCLQRGRSYNEVTRVDLIPQDDVLIGHTEGPREDTGRGRRPHAQERGPGRDRPRPRPRLGRRACRTGTHKALFFEPPRSPHCYVSPSTLNRWLVETAAHEKPAPKTLRETISPSPARGTDTGHALAWLSPPSARIPHDKGTFCHLKGRAGRLSQLPAA